MPDPTHMDEYDLRHEVSRLREEASRLREGIRQHKVWLRDALSQWPPTEGDTRLWSLIDDGTGG